MSTLEFKEFLCYLIHIASCYLNCLLNFDPKLKSVVELVYCVWSRSYYADYYQLEKSAWLPQIVSAILSNYFITILKMRSYAEFS